MSVSVNVFDVKTMHRAINSAPRPKRFLMELLFAGRFFAFDTAEVILDRVTGKRRMAPFVAPYVGGKLMEREGRIVQAYRPPLVQPRDVITPERLQQRAAGENIISAQSPADRLDAENAFLLDSFDQAITRREEWMTSQLVFTGAIHMVGEGVDENFSVGFSNTETLSGADLWSASTADPIGDLDTWQKTVMEKSGVTPNACVMASDVVSAFLAHDTVLEQLDTRNIDLGVIRPQELPNGARYIGSLRRPALDIYEYAEWYVDDSTGNSTPMIPLNKLALVPTADRNDGAQMLYGAWTEMDEATTYTGARIPRKWADKEKNVQIVEVVARPLPLLPNPDAWFVADVL